MASKGSVLKNKITNQILELFSGQSFTYNDGKEIRINGKENGEFIQIKLTLTTAKTPVDMDQATVFKPETVDIDSHRVNVPREPSEAEKDKLEKLLKSLGL